MSRVNDVHAGMWADEQFLVDAWTADDLAWLAECHETTVGRLSGRLRYGSPYHRRLRALVFVAAEFTCQQCGSMPTDHPGRDYDGRRGVWWWDEDVNDTVSLQVDHILAQSRGGMNVLENLQCLCSVCNLRKGNRPISLATNPEVPA